MKYLQYLDEVTEVYKKINTVRAENCVLFGHATQVRDNIKNKFKKQKKEVSTYLPI